MKLSHSEQQQLLNYLHKQGLIDDTQLQKLSNSLPFASYDLLTDALERLCNVQRSQVVTTVVDKIHIPAAHELLDAHSRKIFHLPDMDLPLEIEGVALRNRAERMVVDDILALDDAHEQYQQTLAQLKKQPNHTLLRYYTAWHEAVRNELDSSLERIADINAGPADNPAIVALRAWLHYQKRQYMQSFRPLRKLIAAKPDSAWEWQILLAVTALQIDDQKTATYQLEKIAATDNPFQAKAQAMLEAMND